MRFEALIEPHYPKMGAQGGRRPFPLIVMLRIYCLQQWYGLADPGAEEALYDIQSMCAFAGLELGCDAIPDETTTQFTAYQQLDDCVVWRGPPANRSKAVVTYADVAKAKELLGHLGHWIIRHRHPPTGVIGVARRNTERGV